MVTLVVIAVSVIAEACEGCPRGERFSLQKERAAGPCSQRPLPGGQGREC